jgi:hypothetical protein
LANTIFWGTKYEELLEILLYVLGTLERVMWNLEEEMEAKMTSKDV